MRTSAATSLVRLAAAILLCLVGFWTPTTSAQSRPFCECAAHADCVQIYGSRDYFCTPGNCEPINGLTGLCVRKPCTPNPNPICPQIYDPVTCSNGVTYQNQCYADAACATGCEPSA